MISPDALNAWRRTHPWADDDQVEQDLVMTRIAIEIASHPDLRDRLTWRGGTCLHKLFLPTALRYSEDLDYVAYDLSIVDNDMRTIRAAIRDIAERVGLGIAANPTTTRSRLTERFTYRSIGGATRRIKVEINLDDVPAATSLDRRNLAAATDWWSGATDVLTFQPAELIATKFRALAQRSKGRDLNDLDVAHRTLGIDDEQLGQIAAHYLHHAGIHPNQFRARLAAHLADPDFVADVAVYLTDPATAGNPDVLVYRWISWTDRHLDLPYTRLADDHAPSKRKARAISDIEARLASGNDRCPIHLLDAGSWRRCPHHLSNQRCPDHGAIANPERSTADRQIRDERG